MSPYFNNKPTLRQTRIAGKHCLLNNACRLVAVFAMVILGVLYVAQTSAVSTRGYEISDLQKTVQNLQRDNQKLQLQIADYSSMQSIKTRLQTMNLVAVTNLQYVTPVGTAMARR